MCELSKTKKEAELATALGEAASTAAGLIGIVCDNRGGSFAYFIIYGLYSIIKKKLLNEFTHVH